jgi:plastocyanin
MGLLYVAPANADGTHVVYTRGGFTLEPNEFIKGTHRFAPGTITVRSGDTVKWLDRDDDPEPHTVTVVKESELPQTVEEAFSDSCETCNAAAEAHFEGGAPQQVVNKGKAGLNRPGDSRLFSLNGNGNFAAKVRAPAGTTPAYICIIHPWVQGHIRVQ